MRIIVTGGRDFGPSGDVWNALDNLHRSEPITLLIHGDCQTGVDAAAKRWASAREVDCLSMPAPWKVYGKRAGPMRNSEMANAPYGIVPDLCLVFPGGTGTADMKSKATAKGIHVIQAGERVRSLPAGLRPSSEESR